MVTTITATELARHLSGILNRARYEGERFIIKRNGEAVAILEPIVPQSVSLRQIAAQLARIPRADYRFADDLELALKEMRQPMPEPPEWPS